MVEQTVRSVRFDGPAPDAGTTHVVDVPLPRPGAGQVTIDVAHAGINFVDILIRRGDPAHGARFPVVPGTEASGTVREVGPGVVGLAPGDRVTAYTGLGALAEVVVADAALTAALPDGLGLDVAAAAPAALTSAVLLIDDVVRLRAGESLLVHSAAGGVGRAVAQLARARGARALIGTVGSPSRVDGARAAGYDPVLVRGTGGTEAGGTEAVKQATGGRGVDAVLDPLGVGGLADDLDVAAPGARVVVFGNAAGGAMDARVPAGRLMGGNLSITGFSLSALVASDPARVGEAIRRTLRLLADGVLSLPVTVVPGLDAVGAAQQAMAEGSGGVKQVVAVRPGARPAAGT